jgi:hypothetical protein
MMRTWTKVAACGGIAALLLLGCSNEISKSSSPVELIVTNSMTVHTFDIAPGAANCNQSFGSIELHAITKNPNAQTGGGPTNTTFEQVRVTRYTVSYTRTDGGKQVPAPFTNSLDILLTPGGGTSTVPNFIIFHTAALTQAPFVALLPQNGGRDPDTLQPIIRMDVAVTVSGQTLAGDQVSDTTHFPLNFCYNCGGCGT